MMDEFSRRLEEIRTYCEREGCPKLMRLYHHLLGLQEAPEEEPMAEGDFGSSNAPWTCRSGTRVNDPASVHFSMAEAFESMGNWGSAVGCYEEIAAAAEDVEPSLWRRLRLELLPEGEDSPRPLEEAAPQRFAQYRGRLSLPGNRPWSITGSSSACGGTRKKLLFTASVEDARRRLAAGLESE